MSAFPGYPDLDAWRAARSHDAPRLAAEAAAFEALLDALPAQLAGHCAACDTATRFLCPEPASPRPDSMRESLRCARCGSNARQRAATAVLLDGMLLESMSPVAPIYLTEQAGPFYRALRGRLPGLAGSEFATTAARRWRLQAWLWRHGLFERLRFADVTDLPFADGAFDAAMSLDVLEHVPDFRAALREFARVLRPGGRLVLTVPFHADSACTEAVARMTADGHVEHLQPPEYHGDPLGGGVLCFHHFGWDLPAALRDAGFATAEALHVQDPAQGLPEAVWVLRATR